MHGMSGARKKIGWSESTVRAKHKFTQGARTKWRSASSSPKESFPISLLAFVWLGCVESSGWGRSEHRKGKKKPRTQKCLQQPIQESPAIPHGARVLSHVSKHFFTIKIARDSMVKAAQRKRMADRHCCSPLFGL